MPNNHGGAGRNQGTYWRSFPDLTVLKDSRGSPAHRQPTTQHILDIELGSCAVCGAHWWSDYKIIFRCTEQAQPDANGDTFPVVHEVAVKGQPERHKKGCPCDAIQPHTHHRPPLTRRAMVRTHD